MDKLATAERPHVGYDIHTTPGAGASGGLGAGLLLLKARLRARADAVDEYFQLHDVFNTPWDIVFTAEGSLDSQSSKGKMTVEVARRARQHGCSHVIALAGTIGDGAESVYGEGIAAFTSILAGPLSLRDAIKQTPFLLTNAAERTMRLLRVGLSLNQRSTAQVLESTPIALASSMTPAPIAAVPTVAST
jgi:glycerate kinase